MADQPDVRSLAIGILGGTGDQGQALAFRLHAAGMVVYIGSRDEDRAGRAADDVNRKVGDGACEGWHNAEVAQRADIVIVAVPYDEHADLLRGLPGQLADK